MKRHFAILVAGFCAVAIPAFAQPKPSAVTAAEMRALTAELIENHARFNECDKKAEPDQSASDRCMEQWRKADAGGETAAYQVCLDKSDGGNAEIDACSQAEWARQDRAMNVAYQALRSRVDRKANSQILKTQRAWLAYRDSVCDEETIPDGDSLDAELHRGTCLVEVTSERVKGLRRLFSQLLYFEHDPDSRSILNKDD